MAALFTNELESVILSENDREIINSIWHVLPGNKVAVHSDRNDDSTIILELEGCTVFNVKNIVDDWVEAIDFGGWIRKFRQDGFIVLAEGDYTIGAFWRFRITCNQGAFVRRGLELTSEHLKTERFGSIVESSERKFNAQGLARLKVSSGWVSEELNPLSGQSGKILEIVPLIAPLRYRVILAEGCIVRYGLELSSAIVRTIPKGEYVDICEKKWTDHPSANCIPRLRLLDKSGWISLRINKPFPEDLKIVELAGLTPAEIIEALELQRKAESAAKLAPESVA